MNRHRDSLGRPLPAGADPSLAAPSVPERSDLTDAEAWQLALSYLAAGLPFNAHEVFEMRWRSARKGDRLAWQAMAQWGAALTHEARGNRVGSRRLAERCLANLDQAPHVPSVIDDHRVRASCTALIDQD